MRMDESIKWSSSRFSVRSTFVLVYINDLDTGLTNELLKFAVSEYDSEA